GHWRAPGHTLRDVSDRGFVGAAEAFVAAIDGCDPLPREEFLRDIEPLLVALYAAGLALQQVEPEDDSVAPEALTNDEAAALQRRLGEKFGDFDFYNVVFDPYEVDSTPVTGSLADDIADIYRDLQEGFALRGAGQTTNALWQWRFSFDSH